MLINKENITNYIPQRAPFVMIDELVTADESGFSSTFKIESDNLFLNDSVLSESALVENIAQTCAAGFGYVNSLKEDSEPQLGFIGAVTRLSVLDSTKLNASLSTKVEILNTFDSIHLIQGTVYDNDRELITCQMKIVLA
jgi:predicted hotdog family 3-hydroxylacyl-ACP dehydratase